MELALTLGPGHATELARNASLDGIDGVVAAGGDGTVFEVLNGYFANPCATPPPFGVLPVGTGNAFARDLSLATNDVSGALQLIADGRTKPVDVGRAQCGNGDQFYYLNILGLGFVTEAVGLAHRLKLMGNFSYTAAVLWRTLALRSWSLRLKIDGRELARDVVFVEISNTRYTSNFLMAPSASIEDGLLDVVILNRVSRRRLLAAFPTVFKGTHIELAEVEHFQTRHIEIESENTMNVSPDGELRGCSPVTVSCIQGALRVFCAPSQPR